MQSKSLLIAIAAFAVTTTGTSAYASMNVLQRAGLNEDQIEAFEQARELRQSGDKTKARDVLLEAGIDEETLKEIHEVIKEARQEKKSTIHEVLEAGNYEAFKKLISDSPLADIITSEADFELFKEAHELKQEGDIEGAKEIFDELGVAGGFGKKLGHVHGFGHKHIWDELTEEQRESLKVAREANDKGVVKAILTEAGIDFPYKRGQF